MQNMGALTNFLPITLYKLGPYLIFNGALVIMYKRRPTPKGRLTKDI